MKFSTLRSEYATLWDGMEIVRLEGEISRVAAKIVRDRARYASIEALTGVPWYIVGAMHFMECGGRFDRHLHNGDDLRQPTVNVPRGRGPFASFEDSAADALRMKKFHQVRDWSIERMAYAFETYNGWGHRMYHPDVLTPYLWSGTSHYDKGKYTSDGKWCSETVSAQPGAMAIVKAVAAHACIDLHSECGASGDPSELSPASYRKATPGDPKTSMTQSRTGWAATISAVTVGTATVKEVMTVATDATSTAKLATSTTSQALAALPPPTALPLWVSAVIIGLGIVAIGACAFIWADRRNKMKEHGI